MKRLLLLVAALAVLTPSVKAAELEVLHNRIIVAFKKDVPEAQRREIVQNMGGRIVQELPLFGMVLVEPALRPSSVFKAEMAQRPEVFGVEYDFTTKWIEDMPVSLDATDARIRSSIERLRPIAPSPHRPIAASDEAQWGVKRVNAPAAWATNQGDGIKVAVVDTGIDNTLPDLAPNVAGGYNAVEKDKPWLDDHFHGTHVAGIIAAALDGKGVVGVAPKARLYAVKVLTKEGSGSMFGIMDGMMWCAQNGMQVANMSLGAPEGNFMFEYAVQQMVGAGVTLVAAAGNGDGHGGPSPVNFPAAYKEAIAISALDQADHITPWSSRGPQVAFIAPGLKVPSTVPLSNDPTGIHAYSGTSMATPHVTGLAALAIAKGASTPDAVRAALKAAARPLPGLTNDEQGAGLIDAANLK